MVQSNKERLSLFPRSLNRSIKRKKINLHFKIRISSSFNNIYAQKL